jgi:hypothetical protein
MKPPTASLGSSSTLTSGHDNQKFGTSPHQTASRPALPCPFGLAKRAITNGCLPSMKETEFRRQLFAKRTQSSSAASNLPTSSRPVFLFALATARSPDPCEQKKPPQQPLSLLLDNCPDPSQGPRSTAVDATRSSLTARTNLYCSVPRELQFQRPGRYSRRTGLSRGGNI